MNCCGDPNVSFEKMKQIRESGMLEKAVPGTMIPFKPSDKVLEISAEDYVTWVLDQLRRYNDKHPGLLDEAIYVLKRFSVQGILPMELTPKTFNWAAAYSSQEWDVILRYCALVYKDKVHVKCEVFCKRYIENINVETKRLDDAKVDHWKDLKNDPGPLRQQWFFLSVTLTEIGETMCDELTEVHGLKLLTWAFHAYQIHPEELISISIVFDICHQIIKYEDYLNRLLKSNEFLTQLKSFAPTRIKAAGDRVKLVDGVDLMKAEMGIILQEYSDLIIGLSTSKTFREKFYQMNFLDSIKSSLRILKDSSAWAELRKNLQSVIFIQFFSVLVLGEDVERTVGSLEKLKSEMENCQDVIAGAKDYDLFGRFLIRNLKFVELFVGQLKGSAGDKPVTRLAIKIAEKILDEARQWEKGLKKPRPSLPKRKS